MEIRFINNSDMQAKYKACGRCSQNLQFGCNSQITCQKTAKTNHFLTVEQKCWLSRSTLLVVAPWGFPPSTGNGLAGKALDRIR